MEKEDGECAGSGSPIGYPQCESPPFLGGGGGGVGDAVPVITNADTGMEQSAVVFNSPVVAASGGISESGEGAINIGGGEIFFGGASGDLMMGERRRGRPRKYDAAGNLNPVYVKSPAGYALSTPASYQYSSRFKRGRGRPSASANWRVPTSFGELFTNTAGGDFTPNIITVTPGQDVIGQILTFAQEGHREVVCILSANGSISSVMFHQPGAPGGLVTYEGLFEILTLTGSYTISEANGMKSLAGALSVSLASPDGHVIGGGVAGSLIAATPIQIVVGSFVPNVYRMQRATHFAEAGQSPIAHFAPATVTAATPISQVAAQAGFHPVPLSQLPVQCLGEGDSSLSNKGTPDCTTDPGPSGPPVSDWRESPDLNFPIPVEEH